MCRCPCVLGLFLCAATASAVAKPPSAHSDTYRIVHIYPHDSKAYTQGLIYVDGHLYESTGLNGRSSLRMVDLNTGRVMQNREYLPRVFWRRAYRLGQQLDSIDVEGAQRLCVRPLQLLFGADISVRGRGMGSDARWHSTDYERWNFVSAFLRSKIVSRDEAHTRHPRGRPRDSKSE
jgi:hypothetical protein